MVMHMLVFVTGHTHVGICHWSYTCWYLSLVIHMLVFVTVESGQGVLIDAFPVVPEAVMFRFP